MHAIAQNTGAVTAQGRSSILEDTGFSFVNCKVTGSGALYLGRAWGPFSRVVFAYTYMDNIIIPKGWYNWGDPNRETYVTLSHLHIFICKNCIYLYLKCLYFSGYHNTSYKSIFLNRKLRIMYMFFYFLERDDSCKSTKLQGQKVILFYQFNLSAMNSWQHVKTI